MRSQVLAFLSVLGVAAAQGVTSNIAPAATAPASCKSSLDSKFEIAIIDLTNNQKRDLAVHQKRAACSSDGVLVAELKGGVITDSAGRTGYVASNYQFQFDKPAQAGAIYTAGFSVCGNGSLALGDSAVFYQCRSGDFYNLYDRWWAEQCSPVEILVMPCGGADTVGDEGKVTVGTANVQTTVVIPLSDGQPQVITTTRGIPICQIGDGQIQGHTTPCAAITAVPTPSVVVPPASQYPDGQIQVTPKPGPSTVPTGVAPTPASVPTGNTTLRTTAGVVTTPAVVPTSAPGANSAGRVKIGSAAALAAGLVVVFL
ncbi:hypothetical protein QBC42DRAFT_165670 [Cladorrhinum samala]|uniref:Cell wall mannoprotein PIR1-like C-terminal domain-containing protein n=1 Tax=Cladorrhinum samala TaxID=585594 RepID=A0AAV9I0V2_9PEZI|nr:hypothetical protein QBC42DRAFT_165670 [Cladorrhinum samala]